MFEQEIKKLKTALWKKLIVHCKETLSADDYKIIKCVEAQLAGEELPYDIQILHEERQKVRDRINELERKLLTV